MVSLTRSRRRLMLWMPDQCKVLDRRQTKKNSKKCWLHCNHRNQTWEFPLSGKTRPACGLWGDLDHEKNTKAGNTGIWCLIIVLKLAWGSPLTGGGFHLANTEFQVERSCAEPGVDVKDGEQNQGGRWDHLPHLLLVHVVKFVVGHLMHDVLHLLLDVGVLRQHSIDTLASVVPSQQVRAPENDMPDNRSRKWKIQTRYLKCWTTVTAPATTRGARMQVKRMWMA